MIDYSAAFAIVVCLFACLFVRILRVMCEVETKRQCKGKSDGWISFSSKDRVKFGISIAYFEIIFPFCSSLSKRPKDLPG